MGDISGTRIVPNLSEDAYHRDPCVQPSLSSSIAAILINQSPMHAHLRHPRYRGVPSEDTDATKAGDATHAILLENSDEDTVVSKLIGGKFEVVDFDDFRTKAAREKRDELIAAGVTPVTKGAHAKFIVEARQRVRDAEFIREQLREHDIEIGPSETRQCEVSIFWTVETEHGPIQCRGRLDQIEVRDDGIDIIDLKRIRSAKPERCERHCENYGYAIQRAAYIQAVEQNWPDHVGRIRFRWAFIETDRPFAATPAEADGTLQELGESQWERACRIWAECTTTDRWPGYVKPGQVALLRATPWALEREMGHAWEKYDV